ncbi:pyridoxamine 5'-phosphate oxidase family protein [Anaerotignum sp.]|uniref:pyridoxamine 5'-phosphate oxidase family protein n=1 Tax=Anaerotignum sp. TaxID=2039241 RepID=UPI0028AB0FD2|nr:pyridoxamine 5'-phosphate oxidase family protein [Anaerotignum sp.]
MDYQKEFERMMRTHTEIALATAVDEMPNVRIVNFYYEPEEKVLYFSSFGDNQKVLEFEKNPSVAFTTIAPVGEEHVRVRRGMVRKSDAFTDEIKYKFLKKMPEHLMCIPQLLPELLLFEITFDQCEVVLDFEHMDCISLS